jgi:hypothetical protein
MSIPTKGLQAVPEIMSANSNVFLVIARRKNGNVMVYEAVLNKSREITGIDSYWLDLEPSYQRKSRKKGKKDDREELSVLDHFAYGIKVIQHISKTRWEVMFKQYSQKMIIVVCSTGVSLYRKGKNKNLQKVESFFLHDRAILNLLPTVDSIDVASYDLRTNKKLVEKVIP